MDGSPPEINAPAAPARRWDTRWIVGGTMALWLVFSVVMTIVSESSPDQSRSLVEMLLWFLASVPAVPAMMLFDPRSDVGFWICAASAGVIFLSLEAVAWRLRINWLAWVLLAWLIADMVFLAVMISMFLHDPGV